MARRRDYAAEERRRNERARELGFTSRAQMRRALRRREFVPARQGVKIVGKAEGPTFPPFAQAGYASESEYRNARRKAAKWSKAHSRVEMSRYDPAFTGKRFESYYDAFINPSTRANRIENGLDSLRDWLVDEMGFYTPDEFDTKYTGAF